MKASPRVSVKVSINSDRPGLKTMLAEFCRKMRVFAKIQHSWDGLTTVTFQGHPEQFPRTLLILKETLDKLPNTAIVWDERPETVTAENRFTAVTIEEPSSGLKRDPSSGEFTQLDVQEISLGGSANTETLKNIAVGVFNKMMGAATGFGVARGWIPQVSEKHITVKHQQSDQRIAIEVSTLSSMDELLEELQQKLNLAPPLQKLLYMIEDGEFVLVKDVKDLRAGLLHYVLTVNEQLPKKQTVKFTTMEEFFVKLKTDEGMSDEQVETAKQKISEQGITFKQLMASGKHAMTDEKLEKYGIQQGGVRTAILQVIENNQ
ncbi:hypothetical protein EDD86DRAFT_251905 [Gorgonomyces haynaldii]|nr:hypothetical protein EDD86DRAFT_252261 [Gorgonomyces haynaldii]KAI8905990.1 hypothetical protein EDD86DRAFT_251905 [Gorgonomyces haynaldii]